MGKSRCMLIVGVVVAVMLQCAVAQTVHVVGDSMGWIIPPGGAAAYTTWASTKNFVVNDILTFNFSTNAHDVLEVPKASFDACTSANAIGTAFTNGPANITLTSAGEHYYICTFGQHCQNGQKLAITVSSSPGTIPPSGSPAPPTTTPSGSPAPPTTTTPATPSPTSGTPADCTPAPASAPKAGGPTGQTTPATPSTPAAGPTSPGSSSSVVFASFFVTLLSVAMGFFV
ncbi:hypothetical protein L1049_005101 [Liquidambar formosana]|uniref:Phytocyanin domain-containing protein n=1 Tax=Liquidambar formosana TaxID=63359 RepID=A0AAP0WWC4_LIQFO